MPPVVMMSAVFKFGISSAATWPGHAVGSGIKAVSRHGRWPVLNQKHGRLDDTNPEKSVSRFWLKPSWIVAASLMASVSTPGNATANPETPSVALISSRAEEIRGLIKSERYSEAEIEIGRSLKQQPKDPAVQFLQCVLKAQQNQVAEAVACYGNLVKAYPDMVEAYNNLAVLHASQGKHEEAKQWLDKGMRRIPAMWTIHQNILGLQADLSRKAYARALQIEISPREPAPRLSMLASSTVWPATASAAPTPKVAEKAAAAPRLAPSQPASAPPATVKADAAPAASAPMAREPAKPSAAAPAQTASSGAVPAQATATQPQDTATRTRVDETTRMQVQNAIETWARAWSEQNLPAYFSAYSENFSAGKSTTRAEWEAERVSRITGRNQIRVTVSHLSIESSNQKVVARFNQVYESDRISSSGRKKLEMVLEGGSWKILRETVISR